MRSFFSPRSLPLFLSLAAASAFASVVQKPLLAQPQAQAQLASSLPSLADVLTTERRLSIFYDYLRDVPKVNERLSSPLLETTLLVPLNSAILALPKKPHQSSPPASSAPLPADESTLSILQQDSLVSSNIKRFISAHTVPQFLDLSPAFDSLTVSSLLSGLDLTFTRTSDEEGKWTVANGLNVMQVLEASNGRVVVLDGVVEFGNVVA